MDNQLPLLLTIFIAVTSIAVVLQMVILAGIYARAKKTSARVEDLSAKIENEALPTLVAVRELIAETKPKFITIIDNVESTTTTVRTQAERVSLTMNDVLDRTRLQVMRADEMVTRTLDNVEHTTQLVQTTVMSPMHKMSALMDGVITGVGAFMGQRKVNRQQKAVPHEEMFI